MKYKMGWAPSYIEIDDSWNVLDVGSGHNPHPRANVICDTPKTGNEHRSGHPLKKDKRFIWGDIESLPFKDKEFDFIICTHVLEHVNNPIIACNELIRVGKAGYIETPSKCSEIFLPRPGHVWYISFIDGVLIFEPIKKRSTFDFNKMYLNDKKFHKQWHDSKAFTYITLSWNETFKYKVIK
ncbi:MAG: class I SAM-dependent methyltransferase [Candidatus Helarchaeales archaeon]